MPPERPSRPAGRRTCDGSTPMMRIAKRIGLAALVVGLVAALGGRTEAGFITYTETVIASGSTGPHSRTRCSPSRPRPTRRKSQEGAASSRSPLPLEQLHHRRRRIGQLHGERFRSLRQSDLSLIRRRPASARTASPSSTPSTPPSPPTTCSTPIGPITGSVFINPGTSFSTTAGGFSLTSTTGNVKFTAVVPSLRPRALVARDARHCRYRRPDRRQGPPQAVLIDRRSPETQAAPTEAACRTSGPPHSGSSEVAGRRLSHTTRPVGSDAKTRASVEGSGTARGVYSMVNVAS